MTSKVFRFYMDDSLREQLGKLAQSEYVGTGRRTTMSDLVRGLIVQRLAGQVITPAPKIASTTETPRAPVVTEKSKPVDKAYLDYDGIYYHLLATPALQKLVDEACETTHKKPGEALIGIIMAGAKCLKERESAA